MITKNSYNHTTQIECDSCHNGFQFDESMNEYEAMKNWGYKVASLLGVEKHFCESCYEKYYKPKDTKRDKPPLGIAPRFVKDYERVCEITSGITRYFDSISPIPLEWIDELREIVERENARIKGE